MGDFAFDYNRALVALDGPDGSLTAVNALADTDQLRSLIASAEDVGAITQLDEGWAISIDALATPAPRSIVGVSKRGSKSPASLVLELKQEEGEDDRDFTLRLIKEVVADANRFVDPRTERLEAVRDRIRVTDFPPSRNILLGGWLSEFRPKSA